jgi:hypothetical protein
MAKDPNADPEAQIGGEGDEGDIEDETELPETRDTGSRAAGR